MDKLISLLKDYIDTNGPDTKELDKEYGMIDTGEGFLYGTREYSYLLVISRKFGFIKWLVDNDKIDYEKVDKSWNDEMSFVDFKLDNIMEIRIKVVLMLLAIQDEPIEFLISILK